MRRESKYRVKNSITRAAFVALSMGLQGWWAVEIFKRINDHSAEFSLITTAFTIVIVLYVFGKEGNSAMKTPWIMAIMAFPVLGICLYLLCGTSVPTRRMCKRYEGLEHQWDEYLYPKEDVLQEIKTRDRGVYNQCKYITDYGMAPVYRNEGCKFFADTREAYDTLVEDIRNAKEFVFMEYFAIEDSQSFDKISKLLREKVKQGVEVRIMYDDVGSIGFVNPKFARDLQKDGIQCRIFNPLIPFWNLVMNNRDHRKITVIDGKIAHTGGYNLANEYFNITHPYGEWKDSGVRIQGEAVRSFTKMLLQMWNVNEHTDGEYSKFFPKIRDEDKEQDEKGYVQPYCDCPIDGEHVGESIYMNILKNAKEYVYITTPYLIISDEMKSELILAAKRGVDVRIITPGIPDKKVVYRVTRSYYAPLVKAGVRIYEFEEGFCHAKQWVSDGEVATVGTVNMDYRSLYLHFEDGVFLYKVPEIEKIYEDCKSLFKNEVSDQYKTGRKSELSIIGCVLRIIAPLL